MMYRCCLVSLLLAACLCCASCADDAISGDSLEGGVRLDAPLLCSIASPTVLGDASVVSRAAEALPENKVDNVWVFQFEGTAPGSLLLGNPLYFEMSNKQSTIKVTASNSQQHRLVFVANTNNADYDWQLLSGKATYENLVAKTMNITPGSFPKSDTNLPLVGHWEGVIDAEKIAAGFKVQFKHSVAKIMLELELAQILPQGFTVRSVQLKQVPARMRWCDGYLEMSDATAVFPGAEYAYINYDKITDRLPTTGTPQTYVWYMPRNHQGVSINEMENQKNSAAMVAATYIEIMAMDENKKDIRYRLYPGANMLNNFNITPHNFYNLKLTVNGAGDPNTDSRVEHLTEVVLPKANCYIINPPEEGLAAKMYYIPIERVNDFWADPDYAAQGQEMSKAFTESTSWGCEVIWVDNNTLYSPDKSAQDRLTFPTDGGTGIDGKYLQVRVPTMNASRHGNIVVGVYRKDASGNRVGGFAWSWHLWVTDYNPDIPVAVSEKVHVYPVPGGQVERYGGVAMGYINEVGYDSWTSIPSIEQPYAGKLLMDRALGVSTASLSDKNTTGEQRYQNPAPLYQYGRKDPLPPIGKYSIYDKANSLVYQVPTKGGRKYSAYCNNTKIATKAITMAQAIEEPDKFVFGHYYTYWQALSDGRTPLTLRQYVWSDLKQGFTHPDRCRKTLHDPCPPGWRLPYGALWNELKIEDGSTNSSKMGREELAYTRDEQFGLRYWPYKIVGTVYPVEGKIFYPYYCVIDETGISSDEALFRTIQFSTSLRLLKGKDDATITPDFSSLNNTPLGAQMIRCVQE